MREKVRKIAANVFSHTITLNAKKKKKKEKK